MTPPTLFFFLKIALAIQGHTNFRIIYTSSVKNAIGILIKIALNLDVALGSMDILTLLILPFHEHGISFYLFVLSSILVTNVLEFSKYRSFTPLVKSIPR